MILWITFIVSASFIVGAGIKLAFYGDIIAEKSGLGRTIVGLLLISFATSLPEMVTAVRSAMLGNPDLVMGNMFGSNLFNLGILAFMDFSLRGISVYSKIDRKSIRTAASSLVLLLFVLLALSFIQKGVSLTQFADNFFHIEGGLPVLFKVGFDSLLVSIIYIIIIKKIVISKHPEDVEDEKEEEKLYDHLSFSRGIIGFSIAAVVIIIAGLFLTNSADTISKLKINGAPLGGSFVGSLFLAIVTSLPELVATIGALKLGAYNMAIGNIFGSNIYNIFILFLADIFFRKGSITYFSSKVNLITGLIVVLMTLIVMIGSHDKAVKKIRIGSISLLLIFLYILNQIILFTLRA